MKDIPGFEGKYAISSSGEVYSYRSSRILKNIINKNDGYYRIQLGRGNQFLVHSLVAMTFLCKPNKKLEVNHKNGIKSDNRVENLEWCTHKENMSHAWNVLKIGLSEKSKQRIRKFSTGKRVIQLDILGNIKNIFESCSLAERIVGIKGISECASGKHKTCGGYQWQYLQTSNKETALSPNMQ